jgi:hypothetical protein
VKGDFSIFKAERCTSSERDVPLSGALRKTIRIYCFKLSRFNPINCSTDALATYIRKQALQMTVELKCIVMTCFTGI